jgi:hypothetical protein
MNDRDLEARLRSWYRAEAGEAEAAPLVLRQDVVAIPRTSPHGSRRSGRGRGITLLAAAALLLIGGALAAGSGLLRLPTVVPPVPDPSVIAVATASPDATSQSPSPTPTAPPGPSECVVPSSDPSEPTGPLAWTPESLRADWPAPVRPEAAGRGSVQPMPLTYLDPSGDTGSDAFPCIDIHGVIVDGGEMHLKLDSGQPVADPAVQWIAYGIVTDNDRDGVPDSRYGIDNTPAEACDLNRGWRTNLHTGQTDADCEHGDPVSWNGGGFKGAYPSGSDAGFRFGGSVETTTAGSGGWGFELDMPFYAWASVIVNGRVVATDYAPDAGWLVATRGARPGGTFLLGDPAPDLSMTVPDGWSINPETTFVGDASELRRVACGDLPRDHPSDEGYDPDCALVRFVVIDDPEDFCYEAPSFGPSFDDLVTYVAGLPSIVLSESVTVDGYRGKYFEPSHEGSVDCANVEYDGVWVLDVDGVRLMIGSVLHGDLPHGDVPEEAVKAQIRQMVESIHFER